MAGLTVTCEQHWKEGKIAHAILKITFDDSYPTGGETLDLTAYMKDIWFIDGKVTEDVPGYILGFDDSNFSSGTTKVEAFYADYDAVADGALIEVANTTDLSTVSARLHAIGSAF